MNNKLIDIVTREMNDSHNHMQEYGKRIRAEKRKAHPDLNKLNDYSTSFYYYNGAYETLFGIILEHQAAEC